MDDHHPAEIEPLREERVRALGFDPGQLTPAEQMELIDIYSAYPNEALEQGEWVAG